MLRCFNFGNPVICFHVAGCSLLFRKTIQCFIFCKTMQRLFFCKTMQCFFFGQKDALFCFEKPCKAYYFFQSFVLVHLPPQGGLLIGGPGNGAPPPSKSRPYAIIYDPRAETKHTPKVYDAAPLNDRLKELIRAVILYLIDHGCFAKLQGFNFFTSIH